MRVVHVLAGDSSGGAYKGVEALVSLQLKMGLQAEVLNLDLKYERHSSSYARYLQLLKKAVIKRWVINVFSKANAYINHFSDNFSSKVCEKSNLENADIIHLHWVSGFAGPKFLKQYAHKMVWTLRDEWVFTGGCHYTLDCEQFTQSCNTCPLVGTDFGKSLIRKSQHQKYEHLNRYPIEFVTIGQSLAEKARRSAVLKDASVQHINNLISDKSVVKPKFNYISVNPYALVIAENLESEFKGLDLLIAANLGTKVKLIGKISQAKQDSLPSNFEVLGSFTNRDALFEQLAGATVLIVPSIAEAFGKIIVESFRVGTPVVCFPIDEPRFLVEDGISGIVASSLSSESLRAAIERVFSLSVSEYEQMRYAAYKRYKVLQDERAIHNAYLTVYQKVRSRALSK
jgi:glycosyltransferase involved in cell wall biosynthesis